MDGEVITAMRTAAVSAIATKYLAEKKNVLAVLGSGVQAKAHVEAFCKLFPIKKVNCFTCPHIKYSFLARLIVFCLLQINIWNHRPQGAEQLANYVNETFKIETKVFAEVEACVKEADVVVAATFATEPILKDCPMNPWVHINCK